MPSRATTVAPQTPAAGRRWAKKDVPTLGDLAGREPDGARRRCGAPANSSGLGGPTLVVVNGLPRSCSTHGHARRVGVQCTGTAEPGVPPAGSFPISPRCWRKSPASGLAPWFQASRRVAALVSSVRPDYRAAALGLPVASFARLGIASGLTQRGVGVPAECPEALSIHPRAGARPVQGCKPWSFRRT